MPKTEERFVKLTKAVDERSSMKEEVYPTAEIDSFKFPSPQADFFDDNNTSPRANSTLTSSDESEICHHENWCRFGNNKRNRRRYHRRFSPLEIGTLNNF